ncbi:MAG: Plug domain-containing protein [Ignavibacteria bacterium]|nr:Plug domain-containing protein [Ignavibacteria bacterium]
MFKHLLIFCFFAAFVVNLFSQDSTRTDSTRTPRTTTKTDTTRVQNFILSDHNYLYINKTDPDTLTRRRFLWYPAKSLEDILNYVPGYYLYYMDVGQLNPFTFNQFAPHLTGVLRNGRAINDMFDGYADMNLLSRNEISEMEFSDGYNNNRYDYKNTVNIIQRELFQFRPYTEISFFQDRYENLYFDGNFHQNFFSKLNFNFGITKHSYDGHYTNSAFDKWLGRFNLTFAPSNRLNFFLKVNYSMIDRELNEGINPDTVNFGSKDDLFDAAKAVVFYDRQHERRERFDVDLGGILLAGKISFSKLQFFVSNSLREYFQIINLINPFSSERRDVYHWINYGVTAQQQFKFKVNNDLSVTSNSEGEYSYLIRQIDQQVVSPSFHIYNGSINLMQELSLKYRNLLVSGFINAYSHDFPDNSDSRTTIYLNAGGRAVYENKLNENTKYRFKGTYNHRYDYFSFSGNIFNPVFNLGSEFYYYAFNDVYRGINNKLELKVFKFRLSANHNYNFRNSTNSTNPQNSGRINLVFEDNAFKNKLEYKVGLTSRFWSEYLAMFYSGQLNTLYYTTRGYYPNRNQLKVPANATLDFYISGKIGKATFGLTLENILDRIVYNTGLYPFMDRGGFLNTISRFNITWNFFD